MRHDIRAEIDIEAPPAEVWRHLIDLAAYRDWNPFIPAAAGRPEVGQRLSLRMQPPGAPQGFTALVVGHQLQVLQRLADAGPVGAGLFRRGGGRGCRFRLRPFDVSVEPITGWH